jgi:NDP-sugar pyrophosphorylase family protein
MSYSSSTNHKKRTLVVVQKAQISADSMIGDSTQVGDRTSIKTSVIGRHCIIGKMVKITGCVILDHCVVDDECVRLARLGSFLTFFVTGQSLKGVSWARAPKSAQRLNCHGVSPKLGTKLMSEVSLTSCLLLFYTHHWKINIL